MKNQFSIVLVAVLLVIGQVPESEQFEWSWTSFKNRISDTFRSSSTTTPRPSWTYPTTTSRTAWPTTSRASYYPTTTTRSITTRSITTRRTTYAPPIGIPSTTASTRARTCACGDESAAVCASNGVTYKNRCKFDCAKARVNRLRIVSNRACGDSMNRNEYWGSSSRRN